MKIITISREFGSGGRELGKRLADLLHFDYYDGEIIAEMAKRSREDADHVEKAFANHEWKQYPFTFRSTLDSSAYAQSGLVQRLLEQMKVIEKIASLGKDCIIVGRNADVILEDFKPLNIFVCAETEAKLRRCMERAPAKENLTEKELTRKMKQVDKMRSQTRAILSGSDWGDPKNYHLTVNTTDWSVKEMVPAVAEFAARWFGREV